MSASVVSSPSFDSARSTPTQAQGVGSETLAHLPSTQVPRVDSFVERELSPAIIPVVGEAMTYLASCLEDANRSGDMNRMGQIAQTLVQLQAEIFAAEESHSQERLSALIQSIADTHLHQAVEDCAPSRVLSIIPLRPSREKLRAMKNFSGWRRLSSGGPPNLDGIPEETVRRMQGFQAIHHLLKCTLPRSPSF